MLNNIYLFKHANYYNRIVKRFDHLNEYVSNSNILASYSGINFNPNDGVSTNLVINYNEADMPDYLIVADENVILSRWYIIESRRTRSGQFSIDLYRDVIADWYEDIINAPCFIEKAMVSLNDRAIFNNEDMEFNQIKTAEYPLTDPLKSGWYVGYYAKGSTPPTVTIPKVEYTNYQEYNSFDLYPYHIYSNGLNANFSAETLTATFFFEGPVYYMQGWDLNGNPKRPTVAARQQDSILGIYATIDSLVKVSGYRCGYEAKRGPSNVSQDYVRLLTNTLGIDWYGGLNSALPSEPSELKNLLAESGKIYKIEDNFYSISVIKSAKKVSWIEANTLTPYGGKFKYLSDNNAYLKSTDTIAPIGGIEYSYNTYTLQYNLISDAQLTYNMAPNRTPTLDAPYDVFAIPAGSVMCTAISGASNPETSRKLVEALIVEMGSNLYDIQYLPYFPESQNVIAHTQFGQPYINAVELSKDNTVHYQAVGDTFVIYPSRSSFEFSIQTNTIDVPADSIEFKVTNECDIYRICSPNYNGQFEFSAAKNYGVSGWNVSYTCKPYTPYIKVAPIFNGLYGKDYGDARGLICGGDFSISQIESKWQEYQINNKNYQVMFDRQIQNMEVNNSIQRIREGISAITGSVSGAISGGMTAGIASSGNPYAIAAGAVVGGTSSTVAGVYDIKLNERLRREAIDYTKDQFGYSLRNIKAMPYSLTKVGTQNIDYKIFPFVEYYTCSDIEKQALRNKIKYNGMTVMRIGNIAEFIQPESSYIKGKLIRLESIYDDYHVVNMIAKELNEGVFI